MSSGTLRRRRLALPQLRLRRPRLRTLAILAALAVLLGGGWLWLRQSSLVGVQRVTVVGVSGADAGKIRAALLTAARSMTTLDVDSGQLRTAVAPFPDVKRISVSTQFPHGLTIDVTEDIPVADVDVDGRTLPVAGDGTLLPDITHTGPLPLIPLPVAPGGSRLTERTALNAVAVLASAPYQFLPKISQVTTQAAHGVVAALRHGPSIYFGSATQLAAKWQSVVAVLADAGSVGALYIDVSDPRNPVAGGGSAAAALAAQNATASGSVTTSAAATAGTVQGSGTTTDATTTASGAAGTVTGTASTAAGTATAPAGTATAPAGTATAPAAGTATDPGGTATAPAGTATAPAAAPTDTTPSAGAGAGTAGSGAAGLG